MSTASVTNTFVNAAVADADEVNTNFSDLVTFLNGSVVHVDGSKAFTGVVQGVTPTADAHLATKAYVDGHGKMSVLALTGSAQSIPDSTDTKVEFNNEPYAEDTDYFTNNTTTNRITVDVDGTYLIRAQVLMEGHATGQRKLQIRVDGIAVANATIYPNSTEQPYLEVSHIADMSATSYVTIFVRQDSGGALEAKAGATSTNVTVVKVG